MHLGHHAKELLAAAAAVVGGAYVYKKFWHGTPAAPANPSGPTPQPAPPPAPAPAPAHYDPGTLTGPNPGDTNGLVTYNPTASQQTVDINSANAAAASVDPTADDLSAFGGY